MAMNITMPALSPTMTEGTLSRWTVNEGDTVQSGDIIAEIETDKATMEVEAIEDGIIGKFLVAEGTEGVKVNAPIAILLAPGEKLEQTSRQEASAQSTQASHARDTKAVAPSGVKSHAAEIAPKRDENRCIASPLARRLAAQENIDLRSLKGSGPHGRIIRRDVLAAGQTRPATTLDAPATPSSSELSSARAVPNSSMRKVIARRLSESKQTVPHFYVSIDVELDAMLALRSRLNTAVSASNEEGSKISVNDMMIKAVAMTLKQVPAVNVRYSESETLFLHDIDISIAVSVKDGLITPILRNADRKSLYEISQEAKDLIQKARSGKLKPEEFQGGSFSISNMGMFGVKAFSAIINPPQAAILAIAAGEKRPVVRGDKIEIATVMTATLSLDHRAIDGALGAEWLKVFRDVVQNPYRLVI